ncbi:MAG TPA: LysR substrate-binding domain-containing protein [Blastocatellia bacterium]|nr:LysR substrate-binding domain-containing protein [Blastocatellia bacterium]
MELRHLRYFVAIAEELNFRRASKIVHIAQPALSQQIKQLEDELGVALFVRSHHKVELTAAGRTFYASAQMILKEARQAVADARAVEQGEAGRITVAFVSSAAISVLPSLLTFIRVQLPRAEVELKELAPGEQIDALYHHKLDLGIFHAQLEDAAFETAVMAREALIVALPGANRFAKNRSIDLHEIAGETIIIPARHATPGYFERARAAFQAAGVLPERIYHTSLLQTGLLLVGAGLGISLVPESFRRIKVQGVVYRPLANGSPTIDLIAAWRRDNNSPLLARLANEIRAHSATLLTA